MKDKGITLLLAVFVSSVTLTLGMGIFTLFFGELRFSGSAKESLIAFYASDSGIECALYWDSEHDAFATTSTQSISCDEDTVIVGGASGVSKFTIFFDNGSCAKMKVEKTDSETIITSLGENNCGAPSERVVQRGLQVNY